MLESKYIDMLETYKSMRDTEAWSDPIMSAIHCLDDSDWFANLQGNDAQALRDRYQFRNGAALMLASVFGLDIDAARGIMKTHAAWADYEEACKHE